MINCDSPTEKQIELADEIARALNIDFPTCSAEYTKLAYQQFISTYYENYRVFIQQDPAYDDDEMLWWDPFAEGGY